MNKKIDAPFCNAGLVNPVNKKFLNTGRVLSCYVLTKNQHRKSIARDMVETSRPGIKNVLFKKEMLDIRNRMMQIARIINS